MKQTILIILAITLIISCSCDPVIVDPVPLPLPAKPALPTIKPNELTCLTQSTYAKQVEREQRTRGILITPGFFCHTLELPWRDNQQNISCIPAGEYECLFVKTRRIIGGSSHSYWLKSVPGRTGVLQHAGTFAGDKSKGYRSHVLGCILLGHSIGTLKGQKAIFQTRRCVREYIEHFEHNPLKLIIRETY